MIRHDLLQIHPAKTSWQETTAHALDGTDAAAFDQNEASTLRSCRLIQAVCRPAGAHASRSTSIPPLRATAPSRNPHSLSLDPRGSYM